MQNKTFEPGQEVFFEDGEMAYYIEKVGDYHAVEPVYERHNSEDHYTYTGEPILVGKVYPEPLTVKKSAQIAELDAEIEEKQKKLREVSGKLWEAENSQKKLVDALAKNEALAQIENLLSGNITHYVSVDSGRVNVEAVNARDRYSGSEFRLSVDLKDKAIKWSFVARGDRWSETVCFPFPNEPEAITFAKKHILELAGAPDLAYYAREDIIKSAAAFEVVLPDAIHQAHKAYLFKSRTDVRDRARAELDKANKALAELGGGDDA